MTSVVGARPSPYERLVPVTAMLAVAVSLAASALTGRAVAVPLVGVGLVSLLAGVVDARTGRIPNVVAGTALAAFLAGVIVTAVGDHRGLLEVAAGALAGFVLSGAPLLGLLWVVQPSGIGAGDVKLLSVQGATIGLLAPLAVPLMLLGGVVVASGQSALFGRRRTMPLGPGLAVGYFAAIVAGTAGNVLFGGAYG